MGIYDKLSELKEGAVMDKNIVITITEDKKVFLNFDSPVGKVMLKKIDKVLDSIDNVSKD